MTQLSYGKIFLSLLFLCTSYYFSIKKENKISEEIPKSKAVEKRKTLSIGLPSKRVNEDIQPMRHSPQKQENRKTKTYYYDGLIESIDKKVLITVINNKTYTKKKIYLSGEEIFKKIKNDLNNGYLNKVDAASKFKEVMGKYYKLNTEINNTTSQKNIPIDLLDFYSFYKFTNLREAFEYYKKASE